jgi:hypothetical protein
VRIFLDFENLPLRADQGRITALATTTMISNFSEGKQTTALGTKGTQ